MALQLNDFEQNIIVSKAHERRKKLYKRTPSVFNIGPKKNIFLQWRPVWKTTSKYISGLASNEIGVIMLVRVQKLAIIIQS